MSKSEELGILWSYNNKESNRWLLDSMKACKTQKSVWWDVGWPVRFDRRFHFPVMAADRRPGGLSHGVGALCSAERGWGCLRSGRQWDDGWPARKQRSTALVPAPARKSIGGTCLRQPPGRMTDRSNSPDPTSSARDEKSTPEGSCPPQKSEKILVHYKGISEDVNKSRITN